MGPHSGHHFLPPGSPNLMMMPSADGPEVDDTGGMCFAFDTDLSAVDPYLTGIEEWPSMAESSTTDSSMPFAIANEYLALTDAHYSAYPPSSSQTIAPSLSGPNYLMAPNSSWVSTTPNSPQSTVQPPTPPGSFKCSHCDKVKSRECDLTYGQCLSSSL